jgi:GNAT superfamily N-acetyltransferase
MNPIEYHHGDYTISTDKASLNIPLIHETLSQHSYWAKGRRRDIVERSIENSLCFGVYKGEQQVGFARVVTDYATFAWLCDVFILGNHQNLGLGKWLVRTIVNYPELQNGVRFLLATDDAHALYARYGDFETLPMPEKWMIRPRKD